MVGFSAAVTIRDRNLLVLILSIELLFFAVSIFYAALSCIIPDPRVAALALNTAVVVVAIAAAEAAVFLALIANLYKSSHTIRLRGYKLKK